VSVEILSTAGSTTVRTTFTTNPQQNDVHELKHYGRRPCSKLCARWVYNIDRSAAAWRPSSVWSTSSTVDEFCWQHDRLAVAKFSKSTVWDQVPAESILTRVVDLCKNVGGSKLHICWWNENFKFCCHKTMFTETSLVSSNNTAQIFLLHNCGQNKCRQLLIALKPLFVLNVLHNSMNHIWLLSMSC